MLCCTNSFCLVFVNCCTATGFFVLLVLFAVLHILFFDCDPDLKFCVVPVDCCVVLVGVVFTFLVSVFDCSL